MKPSQNLYVQIRSIRWTILGILLISAVLFGVVLVMHFHTGIPVGKLTRDPATALERSVYFGFLSQVGILFWAASAAICLLTTYVFEQSSHSPQLQNVFFSSGILSLILGLDDAFMFHEVFSRNTGIPETIIFASYLGSVLLWLVHFRSLILRTEYLLFIMALALFGISIFIDVMEPNIKYMVLFEDGAKLMGILTWLAYFFRFGAFAISCHISDSKSI